MDSSRNFCITASITSARGPEATPTLHVPPELMLKILQHLPQHDLRVFSQASRACYAHALEAGLCIRRDIFWTNEDGFGDSLEMLDAVIDHAENRPSLNIAITVMTMPWGDGEAAAAAYHNDMNRLVASVRRALPNLLRLQVPLADYAALCASNAPKLEALTFYHPGLDVPSRIPSNIFNGCAQRLCKVELSLTDTDTMQAIAALSNVTHLKLSAGRVTRCLHLALLFPALRVLAIDARSGSTPSAQSIDLRGLTALRHFALAGDIALLDDGSLALLKDIPVFEHQPEHTSNLVWPAHSGEICSVVERRGVAGPPAISFVPRDPGAGRWRRSALLRSLPNGALPLADIRLLASRLVSLTVDASLVNALAQSSLVLDNLRELVVDLCHSPRVLDDPFMSLILNSVVRVRCPALERVVLLSLPGGEGAGAITSIEPDMVARLRHALRLRTGRPKLQSVLAGCAWRHPDSASGSTHLPQSTSTGDSADSKVVDVPEYYERCHFTDLFDSSRWDEA